MLRTGILLPRSTLFPSLGLDILNGMKEYLKQENVFDDIKLYSDNIGFGIEEQDIYTKAERMLLQDDVDMMILCADVTITEMLQPLFTASNKILLVVNFGANLPGSWQAAPTSIIHSLNFCYHAGLTGKLAALENENKKAVNLLSYYDAGYRQCYCMLNGHQQNRGIPAFNHVTSLHLRDFTIEPAKNFITENPDTKSLLCLFAGEQAERFYTEIAPLQKEFGLHLYGSPMLFESSLKKNLGESFQIGEVKGYVPWHASLNNKVNEGFLKSFSGDPGKPANYFSVLGWDAGMIVTAIFRQHEAGNHNAAAVTKELTKQTYNSPRGWLKIDPETNHSYGPSYLAVCRNNMNITIEDADGTEEEWKQFTGQPTLKGEASGWRNTYLCI